MPGLSTYNDAFEPSYSESPGRGISPLRNNFMAPDDNMSPGMEI